MTREATDSPGSHYVGQWSERRNRAVRRPAAADFVRSATVHRAVILRPPGGRLGTLLPVSSTSLPRKPDGRLTPKHPKGPLGEATLGASFRLPERLSWWTPRREKNRRSGSGGD